MNPSLPVSICAVIAMVGAASAAEAPTGQDKPYRVSGGKVDESTYLGWRAFHSACHTCHGVDATGTDLAPNLVERIQRLSRREFTAKVLTSYRLVLPSGEVRGEDRTAVRDALLEEILRRESGELVMPAWETDEGVQPHVLDLYAYLRARGDGVLPPGRPERMSP